MGRADGRKEETEKAEVATRRSVSSWVGVVARVTQ